MSRKYRVKKVFHKDKYLDIKERYYIQYLYHFGPFSWWRALTQDVYHWGDNWTEEVYTDSLIEAYLLIEKYNTDIPEPKYFYYEDYKKDKN